MALAVGADEQVRRLKADGMVLTEIAKALKIGRASVYRAFA
jgi:DNA invertase Pin-like site-specific DNA recombinase